MVMKICKKCSSNHNKVGSLCNICYLERSRVLYRKRLTTKNCKFCGKSFSGTGGQKNCSDCGVRHRKPKFEQYTQKIVCPKCYKITGFVQKNITKCISDYLPDKVCGECKARSHKNTSQRMKTSNPSIKTKYKRFCNIFRHLPVKLKRLILDKKHIIKVNIFHELNNEEKLAVLRKRTSARMKKNNPMKNKDTVLKMSKTLKDGYSSGRIKKITGPDHWLYLGNKKHFVTKIKSRLYKEWVYPIMKRDNFECVFCGATRQLEVHHLIPLREFIRNCLKTRDIHDLDDLEFEKLKQCVVNAHHLDDGITVCVPCHRRVDLYRK